MITINSVPFDVQFAGNPIRYKVTSDNAIETAGVKAKFTLVFTDLDSTEGHRIILRLMNKSVPFYLRWPLTDLGTDLPAAQEGWTINQWCEQCYNAFIRNYDFFTFYDITLQAPKITFEAKATGEFYSVTIEDNNIVGLDGDPASSYDGEDTVYRAEFGILLQLWNENYALIGEDLKTVDSDGVVRFNVSDYLNSRLRYLSGIHLEYPLTASVFIIEFLDYFLKYKVCFNERYGGVNHRLLFEDDWHRAILGALSHEGLLYWNAVNPDFWSESDNKRRFLTWHPVTKKTSYNSPEYLYFAFQSPTEYTRYRVKVNAWFSDESNSEIYLNELTDITPYSVLQLMVGAAHLELDDTVVKWNVVLINEEDESISEVFTFLIDPRYFELDRTFLFLNSFECWDVFRCTGVVESFLEYERDKGNIVFEDLETPWNPPSQALGIKETAIFKASGGWMSREARNWLRDFMISRQIYEVAGGKLWPLVITSKKAGLFKDKDNNYALEFEYERAYDNSNFSKI